MGWLHKALRACAIAAGLAMIGLTAQANDAVVGLWLTKDGESRVKLERCGEVICGTIVWLKKAQNDDGSPIVDSNNDDKALRTRPIVGLQIMSGFRATEPRVWGDGEIYNPEDGRTYEPTLTLLNDEQLELEACILFFCQSQVWQRLE